MTIAAAAPRPAHALRWEPLGQPACGGEELTRAAQAGATAYAASVRRGRFEGLGKSVDGRRTWTLLEGPAHGLPRAGTPSGPADVHCLPDDPAIAWALVGGTLYRTADGGAGWDPVGGTAGLTALSADPANPSRLFVGGPGGIYLSTDGLSLDLMPGSPAQPDRLALASGTRFLLYAVRTRLTPAGLWRNAGRTWILVRADPAIADVALDPRDQGRLAVVSAGTSDEAGAWLSSDAGRTWSRASAGLPPGGGVLIRFDPRDSGRLLLATLGHGCFAARWPPAAR